MKRLLAITALCLCLPAFAQTGTRIGVSITYTAGAAQAATNAGKNIETQIAALITNANANLSASGATFYYDVGGAIHQIGSIAPRDSASMHEQQLWANNNAAALMYKDWATASFSIQISAPSGTPDPWLPITPAPTINSAAAIAYSTIEKELERALARMMGASDGWRIRARTYPSEPMQGANYCAHTRESDPSDPDLMYPILPYYMVLGASYVTQSGTPQAACEAWRLQLIRENHQPSGTWLYAQAMTPTTCKVWGPSTESNTVIGFTPSPGSTKIDCLVDEELHNYSNQYSYTAPPAPQIYLGAPGHDSIASMNGRVTYALGIKNANKDRLAAAQAQMTACWIIRRFGCP